MNNTSCQVNSGYRLGIDITHLIISWFGHFSEFKYRTSQERSDTEQMKVGNDCDIIDFTFFNLITDINQKSMCE